MIPLNERIWTLDTNNFENRIDDQELQSLAKVLLQRLTTRKEAKSITDHLQVLKDKMQDDIVHFCYDKKAGEHRSAFGTRAPDLISRYGGNPKGDGRENDYRTFVYFDLVRKAWRSFRPENFLSIDDNYEL